MALESSRPQFSKLRPTTKIALQVDSSNVFHSEMIEIYEKKYNDPIQINKYKIQYDDPINLKDTIKNAKYMYDQGKGEESLQKS
jgi:hypothetical protein